MALSEYTVGSYDTRPWGRWEVLAAGEAFVIKRIDVEPGKILSLQSHVHRNEHWTILKGQAEVTLDDDLISLKADESVFIQKGQKHRIRNNGSELMSFIEIQTGEILDEADIKRYSDEYGRAE